MLLAGVVVSDDLVLELADIVDDSELAGRLIAASWFRTDWVTLTRSDRTTILTALNDPPPGLRTPPGRVAATAHMAARPRPLSPVAGRVRCSIADVLARCGKRCKDTGMLTGRRLRHGKSEPGRPNLRATGRNWQRTACIDLQKRQPPPTTRPARRG